MYARARRSSAVAVGGVLDGKLIVVGDSNSSAGAGTGPNGTTTWPTRIASDYPALTVSNSDAYGGALAADLNTAKATDVYPQFDSGKRFNLVGLMAGTNDLATTEDSAATIYGYLSAIITGCKSQGFKVLIDTVLWGSGYDAGQLTRLDALNALIVANSAGADAVYDARAATGTDGNNFSDSFHLSDAGQIILALGIAAKAKEIV